MTSIVISSGHSKYVRGASGYLDEVDEARRVVDNVADILQSRGVSVTTFHDNTSTTQNENLETIVDYHNDRTRDLDVSVHFNASKKTDKPMGTEVLWVTQEQLAGNVARAIADAGDLINRGPKERTDLFFLNKTEAPSILIEVCFVDSSADAALYRGYFDAICSAIAGAIAPSAQPIEPDKPETGPEPIPPKPATVDITIRTDGDVTVTVNGRPVTIPAA